jgi:hypothetical protein
MIGPFIAYYNLVKPTYGGHRRLRAKATPIF